MGVSQEQGEPPAGPHPGWGRGVVMIPDTDFMAGRFPAVCARTGEPATANLRRQAWMPWTWATAPAAAVWLGLAIYLEYRVSLLLGIAVAAAGLLALVVAARVLRPMAVGSLPASAGVADRVARLRTVAGNLGLAWVTAWLAAIAVTLIAGATSVTFPLQLGLALLGAALGVASLITAWLGVRATGVDARLVRDRAGDRWVRLRGVHRSFATALAVQIRSRRSG